MKCYDIIAVSVIFERDLEMLCDTGSNFYIFNSRDIAAYFKWFSVPAHMEVAYMQYFYSLGSKVLVKSMASDFEMFKNDVYRELYYLWANGFENEKSDIGNMPRPDSMALFCSEACINLESYMKLITLHLIFTRNLPYISITFVALKMFLGIKCDDLVFEKDIYNAIVALNLECKDINGKKITSFTEMSDDALYLALNEYYTEIISSNVDIKSMIKKRQKQELDEFKRRSLELEGKIKELKNSKAVVTGLRRNKDDIRIKYKLTQRVEDFDVTMNQPKGAPLVRG